MKIKVLFLFLFLVLMISGCNADRNSSVNSDALKFWDFSAPEGLEARGDVSTGVRLPDGDGMVGRFNGGWLAAGDETNRKLDEIDDYGFSLHVRLQIPDGQWDNPVISKGGADNEFAWRLYGVPFGHNPEREAWEFTRQNYWSYGDSEGRGYALEFELGVQPEPLYLENLRKRHENMRKRNPDLGKFQPPPDIANGIFRVGVPVSMIGPGDWHDVTVRFNGPKLEMFVDGVLVDEEWPIGKIRNSTAPCLIGAIHNGKEITGGFTGSIDHAAIWGRALSDEEISQLCGGPEKVAEAEERILGPEQASLQYWRPRGHNTWAGDVMPVFDEKNGRFHLFYLFDRRHHQSKWGAGAHQFAHASSTDLVRWDHHPLAVPITQQWESMGTGCPVLLGDHWEIHYGTMTLRMFPAEVTLQPAMHQLQSVQGHLSPIPTERSDEQWPARDVPVGQGVAVSKDGILFHKEAVNLTPYSGNIWIFPEKIDGMYKMLWAKQLFSSSDLREWTPVDKNFLPTGKQSEFNNSGECPSYFEWNGWHYVMLGRSGFWLSRDPLGPYWEGPKEEFRGKVVNARWDIYDGLMVPMVAPFKDNRRLLAGFNWSSRPYQNWAGYLVFRELIQYEDGTLGMKWPEEMIPPTGEPLSWKISSPGKAVSTPAAGVVQLKGNGFTTAEIPGLPQSYRFTATIVPGNKATAFGINVKGESGYKGGCELRMEPAGMHAQWAGPQNGGPAPYIPHIRDAQSPQAPHWGDNFALENVEGLDGPFQLDVIVNYDPTTRVTLADACINGQRTMITHRYGLKGNSLYLFTNGGEVSFRDISIRPIKNQNR